MDDIFNEAKRVAEGDIRKVPVVIWAYSMILKRHGRLKEKSYYRNFKAQMESKIAFSRRFPDLINLAVGKPEGGAGAGVGALPGSFGAKIKWFEDSPPAVEEYPIKSPEDIDELIENGFPNPTKEGPTVDLLESLRYYHDWFPRDVREKWPCMDGFICGPICVEGASLAMGYDKFMIWMRDHPDALKKWLKFSTDWYLDYLRAIEDIVGECRILFLPDHSAQFVNKDQFCEFILPHLNKILEKFPGALRIWHNEGSVGRILDAIDEVQAEVWHLGSDEDLSKCREKTHFCLMGNINPPWFKQAIPREIMKKVKKITKEIGQDGKLWLSTGGGVAPGTPFKNLEVLVRAAKKYE